MNKYEKKRWHEGKRIRKLFKLNFIFCVLSSSSFVTRKLNSGENVNGEKENRAEMGFSETREGINSFR